MYPTYGNESWPEDPKRFDHGGLISEAKAVSRLYSEIRSKNGCVEVYIKEVETIVNSQMLGNTTNKSIWKRPYDRKDKKLGTISLENGKVRQILDKFGLLIDASVPNLDRIHMWKRCMLAYRDAIVIVRQKADFSDEECACRQNLSAASVCQGRNP
jgi:hypothetical protein